MSTFIFVFLAIVLFVSFAVLGMRRRKAPTSLDDVQKGIQALDIAAFRNLVDPEEEAFLRAHLPPREFRKIKRERAHAALAYVRGLSNASVEFAHFGETARRSSDPEIAESGRRIAESAIALRMAALKTSMQLRWSLVFPGSDSLPMGSVLDQCDRATSLLQNHDGLTHVSHQPS